MKLSLSQAAKESGTSKPTLSRWIAKGRVSAERQQDGSYLIDASELDRIRDFSRNGNGSGNPQMKQSETLQESNVLQREMEVLRERIADKDGVINDLRRRLDEETEERRMAQAKLTALLTDQREKSVEPKPVNGFRARLGKWIAGNG
jgi:predicted site-specific integrase-resolvase